jgi:hypothetical protein
LGGGGRRLDLSG